MQLARYGGSPPASRPITTRHGTKWRDRCNGRTPAEPVVVPRKTISASVTPETRGPGSLRDFRGALAGRADENLFITSGRFTREAQREAVREGAMAIDLIEGEQLCLLLKEKGLGVVTETVECVTPDRGHAPKRPDGAGSARRGCA